MFTKPEAKGKKSLRGGVKVTLFRAKNAAWFLVSYALFYASRNNVCNKVKEMFELKRFSNYKSYYREKFYSKISLKNLMGQNEQLELRRISNYRKL